MLGVSRRLTVVAVALAWCSAPVAEATAQTRDRGQHDAARLIAAMLGSTPLISDLATLSDEIGGRATGSAANLRAVEWAVARFQEANVPARKEAFAMPVLWLGRSAAATVRGEGVQFDADVAAMPFSTGTPVQGLTRPLVDAGFGSAADFERLGEKARDAFVLVETAELTDIAGLFKEYTDAAAIEPRAFAAGAAGVVYIGSRPNGALYRQFVMAGPANTRPMLVIDRDSGRRALRLLRAGERLNLTAVIEIESGPAYESYNVIGEIRGATKPDETVVIGAHLDSWDLGTGALDNGGNVALVIDVARQMQRLGIRPARTVRFALWNGEEQGLVGSLGYTLAHIDELDKHVMATSIDIGCGRITGFFTNGREELIAAVNQALAPVEGLGPFQQINAPIVGTDNYDFMLQGVANLVANHEPATYGPNYHASSDQFHECDARQLRLNAAVIAALTYGFAQGEVTWQRHTRAEIERLMSTTDLEQQMRTFGLWDAWVDGSRGRSR